MFFTYKLNLPSNNKIDIISMCIIIFLSFNCLQEFFKNGELIYLLMPFLLVLLVKFINTASSGVFSAKYDRAFETFKTKLDEMEANNITLGLTLESDHLIINGLVPTIINKSKASNYNFSVNRKIYYYDISDIKKTKTTTFFTFRDSNSSHKFAKETIFLNYHFEDSETLYLELKKRIK